MTQIRPILMIALLTVSLISGGCATVVHGTGQKVSMSSSPSGADVVVDGLKVCETPCTPELKRKHPHQVTFRKEGYRDEQIAVMKVLSGAVAGNILAGGFIGWGVDAASGAQYRLVPETVHVTLEELEEGEVMPGATAPAITIEARLQDLQEVQAAGGLSEEECGRLRVLVTRELAGGAPAGGAMSPDARLVQLWKLHQQGLITDKEYRSTKKEILDEVGQPVSGS